MAWVTMPEAAKRLGCSVMTIRRRRKFDEDDPLYLPSETEAYRNGERVLVQIPDDALPVPRSEPLAALPAHAIADPPAQTDTSAVVILLQHQADSHEREIKRLREDHAAEIARIDAHYRERIDELTRAWWKRLLGLK